MLPRLHAQLAAVGLVSRVAQSSTLLSQPWSKRVVALQEQESWPLLLHCCAQLDRVAVAAVLAAQQSQLPLLLEGAE